MALTDEDKIWIAGLVNGVSERLDGLSGRVDKLTERVDGLSGRLDGLTERVDGLSGRVDVLAERVDGLSGRMDGLTGRVDGLSGRVDKLTDRLEDQTERIDGLTEKIQDLTSYILEFRTEAIRRFEAIEERLDLMTSAVHSIDVRLPALNKAISDFGATATQVIREQWKAKDLTTDMADRLTRLEAQFSKLIKPAA